MAAAVTAQTPACTSLNESPLPLEAAVVEGYWDATQAGLQRA